MSGSEIVMFALGYIAIGILVGAGVYSYLEDTDQAYDAGDVAVPAGILWPVVVGGALLWPIVNGVASAGQRIGRWVARREKAGNEIPVAVIR